MGGFVTPRNSKRFKIRKYDKETEIHRYFNCVTINTTVSQNNHMIIIRFHETAMVDSMIDTTIVLCNWAQVICFRKSFPLYTIYNKCGVGGTSSIWPSASISKCSLVHEGSVEKSNRQIQMSVDLLYTVISFKYRSEEWVSLFTVPYTHIRQTLLLVPPNFRINIGTPTTSSKAFMESRFFKNITQPFEVLKSDILSFLTKCKRFLLNPWPEQKICFSHCSNQRDVIWGDRQICSIIEAFLSRICLFIKKSPNIRFFFWRYQKQFIDICRILQSSVYTLDPA